MFLTFDFHNHSCLSPCAQLENSPENMADCARRRSIDIFALTDHNSALNAPAFAIACGRVCRRSSTRAGLIPLFGLELSPFEEAHLLVIFPDPLAALTFSDWVNRYLPQRAVNPLQFGDQVAVDPEGNILSMPSAWFGNPLQESFSFFAQKAAAVGALVIPAHVDRPQFSVFSQLGFLPEGPYDAVEAVGAEPDENLRRDCCVISGSDAHVLEHIGRRPSVVEMEEQGLVESFRAGLEHMAAAWEEERPEEALLDQSEGGAASDIPCASSSDSPICGEGVSTKIPDMTPLTDFLARSYPRAEASALFEELRRALRAGRAWGVHRRPRRG